MVLALGAIAVVDQLFILDGDPDYRCDNYEEGAKQVAEMINNMCGDERFTIIAKAKEALLESTNIETSPEEMAVLDDFLFRCWQMGWLKEYEKRGNYDRVPGDTKVYLWDGVGAAAVYKGGVTELLKADVKTHKEDGSGDSYPIEWITLDEIAEQVDAPIITVITDYPLEGAIYEYGNYGDYWVEKGSHMGYA